MTNPTFQEEEALNSLFINYCHEKCGRRNSATMFDKLRKELNEFMESNQGAKIFYQLCYKDHKDLRFNVRIDRIISFDQDGLSHIQQSTIDVFIVLRRLFLSLPGTVENVNTLTHILGRILNAPMYLKIALSLYNYFRFCFGHIQTDSRIIEEHTHAY